MAENIPTRPTAARPSRRPDDTPPAPADLTDESRAIWDRVVGGWVLGAADYAQLHANLQQLELYKTAHAELMRDGPTVTNPNSGVVRAHPAAAMAREALTQFRLGMRALGLEPPE